MPGAPNRPPEVEPPPPANPPSADEAGQRVLRRLAPSRIALRLDVWKGAPHADLMTPFERAEALYGQRDYAGAEGALDQLSVRFAEPRWPTMPLPFRELRAVIVVPQPPQWDPEFALAPSERDDRRARREAERQLGLARGSVTWASTHGVECADLAPLLSEAEARLGSGVPTGEFWTPVDRIWVALHDRVPPPTRGGPRPSPVPAGTPSDSAETA